LKIYPMGTLIHIGIIPAAIPPEVQGLVRAIMSSQVEERAVGVVVVAAVRTAGINKPLVYLTKSLLKIIITHL
jgi:hypothetical protein